MTSVIFCKETETTFHVLLKCNKVEVFGKLLKTYIITTFMNK